MTDIGLGVRSAATALVAFLLLALGACGGGGPPAQTPAVQLVLTGVQLDGATVSTGSVSVKGAAGAERTTAPLGGSIDYSASVDQLTAPYMLAGAGYGVATAPGQANLTPLTTLLTSALFGQQALSAFTSFGTGSALLARVTDANIASAQADVTAFLQNTVGVQVRSGTASFITAPFQPVTGDPMYDTVVALNARIDALGSDAYNALVTSFITQENLCIASKVVTTIGGATANFCPATKSSTPETANATILDDVFTDTAGNALTLRVQDTAVLSGSYVTVAGTTYSCSGTACTGITVGAVASDLTRVITFESAPIGAAVFNGSLTTAIPGVPLPALPCGDNFFFLVQPDRTVIADCVSISAGANTFGVPATFANAQGSTQYGVYPFLNGDSSNANYPSSANPTTVSVVLNGSTLVSVTVTRQTFDPVTGLPSFDLDYKCRASACNGTTVSPPTINSSLGIDAQIRTIGFNGTQLAAVNADGSLSTTTFATLKASFTGIFLSNVDLGQFAPVLASDCASFANQVDTAPTDESAVFGSCPDLVGGSIGATPLPGGGVDITMNNFGSGDIAVDTDAAGAVTSVLTTFTVGENFGCANGSCSGVTVSSPDAGGNITVTFTNATLNIVEPDNFPTGARTAISNGSFVVPPAMAVPSHAARRR